MPLPLQCYLPDLVAMERLGLVAPGSLVLADNVLIPGAPDFLAHVGASTGPSGLPSSSSSSGGVKGSSRATGSRRARGSNSSGGDDSASSSSSGLAWRTELVATMYEVEERYKVDWQPRKDAMSISRCLQAAPPETAA